MAVGSKHSTDHSDPACAGEDVLIWPENGQGHILASAIDGQHEPS